LEEFWIAEASDSPHIESAFCAPARLDVGSGLRWLASLIANCLQGTCQVKFCQAPSHSKLSQSEIRHIENQCKSTPEIKAEESKFLI
jgi:hypothetical protein